MQGYYENHRDDMIHPKAWYSHDDHCTPHFHRNIELVCLLSGEMRATLNGEVHTLRAGQVLVNSSYAMHGYETPNASHCIIAIIPVDTVPSIRRQLSKQSFAQPICEDTQTGTLASLMHMLVTAENNPIVAKGLCYTLLGTLIERIGLVEARSGSRAAFTRDVLEYLEQHHMESLSAEGIAAHFGYSRSRFSHIFNTQLGYTLSEYLGALRCRHAAQLLRETDMSVSTVAMAVGFESLRTFYRTFKKQYEMTPNQYAKT